METETSAFLGIETTDSTSVSVGLVAVAMCIVLYSFHRRQDKRQRRPPCLPRLPVLGSLPFLSTSMKNIAEMCFRSKFSKDNIISFYVGAKYILLIGGKDAINEALIHKSTDFADRPLTRIGEITNPSVKGIVFGRYNAHLKRRHHQTMSILRHLRFGQRAMEDKILLEVDDMITKIRAHGGESFDTRHLSMVCMANVMFSLLFGRRFEHEDPWLTQFVADFEHLTGKSSYAIEVFPLLRFVPYFRGILDQRVSGLQRMLDRLDQQISAALQVVANEATTEHFVNLYSEAVGVSLDREELLFTVRDLITAGLEPTAMTIRWAIIMLANHVSVQDRLHDEIDSVIGRERAPSLSDRSKLPYVEATTLELLRYKTMAPLGLPHITSCDTQVANYFVPAGTTVLFDLYSVHMNPKCWDEPNVFRPERFLDASGNVVGRDRIIPFAVGKRSCLGEQLARQEIFLFLVSLLQNFDFKPPEGQDKVEYHEEFGITLEPSAHLVRIIDRQCDSVI